jgi:hypothetical protein
MLPTHITGIQSIDTYRDGGSIGITFDGEDKYWYLLFFPVRRNNISDKAEKDGYLQPILEIATPAEWTSKITGEQHTDYENNKSQISWADAGRLLEMMGDLVCSFRCPEGFEDYYDPEEGWSIYQEMILASENHGAHSL